MAGHSCILMSYSGGLFKRERSKKGTIREKRLELGEVGRLKLSFAVIRRIFFKYQRADFGRRSEQSENLKSPISECY